jgi:hypothetical protein
LKIRKRPKLDHAVLTDRYKSVVISSDMDCSDQVEVRFEGHFVSKFDLRGRLGTGFFSFILVCHSSLIQKTGHVEL